jgi:hypothetical protein
MEQGYHSKVETQHAQANTSLEWHAMHGLTRRMSSYPFARSHIADIFLWLHRRFHLPHRLASRANVSLVLIDFQEESRLMQQNLANLGMGCLRFEALRQ